MAVNCEAHWCRVCRREYMPQPNGYPATCPTCGKEGIPLALLDLDSPAGVFRSDEDRERHHRREGQKGRQ